MARQNPYTAIKSRFAEWMTQAINRRRISMWHYPKAKLKETWSLSDLWERVAAAEQLGFDVELKATPEGLRVEYVKKLPPRPWDM